MTRDLAGDYATAGFSQRLGSGQICAELAPAPGDIMLRKQFASAFFGTPPRAA